MMGTRRPISRQAMFRQAMAAPFRPVGAQHDLGVLGDDPDQGQSGGVHGVVDGGAQLAQQLGLDAVHHQMDLGQPVQLGHHPLGVPQGGGVVGGHH